MDISLDNTEFDGFNWNKLRSRIKDFKNSSTFLPLQEARRLQKRFLYDDEFAGYDYEFDGFDHEFAGFEDEFSGFSLKKLFKKKPGGTVFGNLLRKGVNIAKGFVPGGLGELIPIGNGKNLIPAEIQAAPAEAVQAAQTPAAAASVLATLAPSLPAAQRAMASSEIMAANSPNAAAAVVGSIAEAEKTAKNKKLYIKIGGAIAGLIVIGLIIWLVMRKK